MKIPEALYFALEKKNLAPKSRHDYKTTVKYIKEACYELDYSFTAISELKRVHVKAIMDKIRILKELSNKGYNKHLTQFKSLLSELVEWEALEHNPAFRLKNLEEEETNKFEILNKEERAIVQEYLLTKDPDFYRFCMTIYYTVIRPKEILSLKIADIDFKSWTIRLEPYNGKTKTKKERLVVICEALRVLFMEAGIQNVSPDFYLFGQYFKPCLTPLSRRVATDTWTRLIKQDLGINKYMYSLKYLGADDLIEAGADEEAVRDHLGHSSKFMTRRYTNKGKERSRQQILSFSTSF